MTLTRRKYRFAADKRRLRPALKAFLLPQRERASHPMPPRRPKVTA